jgi:hypothetical protein
MRSFFKYLDEFEANLQESTKKTSSTGKGVFKTPPKQKSDIKNPVKLSNFKGSKPGNSKTPSVTKVGKEIKNGVKTGMTGQKPKNPNSKFTKPTLEIKNPVKLSNFNGTKPSEAGKKVSFKSPKNEEKIVMKKKTTQVAEAVVSRAQGILDSLPENTEVTLINESTSTGTQNQPRVETEETKVLDRAENLL